MTPTSIQRHWEAVRTSYWFVPAVMCAAAMVISLAAIEIDRAWDMHERFGVLTRTGAEGARAVLATIAGSMITVGATVFSITIVALSLASQQYGPRLLRNFMRDLSNQVVLGTFTSTFLYCLMVLRTVTGDEGDAFVPHLSMAIAVVLALLSLAVLIFYIHHVAVSIQVGFVTQAVAEELDEQIETLFPEQMGEEPPSGEERAPDPRRMLPEGFERDARAVCFAGDGYLQTVDDEALLRIATGRDLVIRLACRPGDFIFAGDRCSMVWPAERLDEETAAEIRGTFAVGPSRNPIQDAEFAINQLVEVALRALSSSLNDPFTAAACIDRLGGGLAKLAQRDIPSRFRLDEGGRLRIMAEPIDFTRLAFAAFDPIRQYDTEHHMVASRLLETIERVAQRARRPADREFLLAMGAQVREQHAAYLRRGTTLPHLPYPPHHTPSPPASPAPPASAAAVQPEPAPGDRA